MRLQRLWLAKNPRVNLAGCPKTPDTLFRDGGCRVLLPWSCPHLAHHPFQRGVLASIGTQIGHCEAKTHEVYAAVHARRSSQACSVNRRWYSSPAGRWWLVQPVDMIQVVTIEATAQRSGVNRRAAQ